MTKKSIKLILAAVFIFILVSGRSVFGNILQYPRCLQSSWQRYETPQGFFYKQLFTSRDKLDKITNFYRLRLFVLGWQEREMNRLDRGRVYLFQKAAHQIELKLWRKQGVRSFPGQGGVSYVELTHIVFMPKFKRELGYDLADVPRYPGAEKIFFVEQEKGKTVSLVYTTTNALLSIENYYKTRMENLGWRYDSFFDRIAQSQSERIIIFEAEDKECIITFHVNKNKTGTKVFILRREVEK